MAIKAAFFDVDGTLTTERVWKGMLEYYKLHKQRGFMLRWFWAYHMPFYIAFKLKLASQSAFRKPWAEHLAWFIKGETPEEAQAVWDWVAQEYLTPYWRKDALQRIQEHKAAGDLVVLVSAGLTPLEEAIAKHVGADLAVGTPPELRHGRYTGRSGPVCLDENKAVLAKHELQQRGYEVDYADSAAYADAITDLGLLSMVGHPVAFHPDEGLKPVAAERGWPIVE